MKLDRQIFITFFVSFFSSLLAVVGIGIVLSLLFGCVPAHKCANYSNKISGFEACRDDPQCRLTAADHSKWIFYRKRMEACRVESSR